MAKRPTFVFAGLAWALGSGCGPAKVALSSDTQGSESTTSDAADETETTAETATSLNYVPESDEFPDDRCDVFEQDCPAGEKCVPYDIGGGWPEDLKCVPVNGNQAPGEPCNSAGMAEATDDCDATSYCWNYGDDGVGICYSFCQGTADSLECPPMFTCELYLYICTNLCDPVAQDCPPGQACYWEGPRFRCVMTTTDIPTGESCNFINDCAAGLICVSAESTPDCSGSACCVPFCDLELGDEGCAGLSGTSCVPFFEEGTPPPGYEQTGVCLVP